MTRGQYVAMCIIGAVAVAAYLQSYQMAQTLRRSGVYRPPVEVAV